MKILLAIFIFASLNVWSTTSVGFDTLRLQITQDSARSLNEVWVSKFKHEVLANDNVLSKDSTVLFKSLYRISQLALEVQFQIYPPSGDSLVVAIQTSTKFPNKIAERIQKNITASIKQAYGFEVPEVHQYEKKSVSAYLGLSMLNVGAGIAYSDYHSFIYDGPSHLAVINGAGEVLSIGFMLSNDGVLRGVGIGMYSLYKIMGLIGLMNINLHNQITASGYKFYF